MNQAARPSEPPTEPQRLSEHGSSEEALSWWRALQSFVWTNRWWVIGPIAALLGVLVLIAVLSARNPLPYLYQK